MSTLNVSPNLSGTGFPAGMSAPQAPAPIPATPGGERRRFDPSSSHPAGSYPVPSFFDYRVQARSTEVL
ncbi:hypothetical protein [Flaviaesturariibacter amylovorans]|uniref:Uncharacterized protein n=1 Tax=Flaviaesturariibacter amylovorans TaxID=1084520 RepID=A0ABP8H450_9BACT